MSKRGRRGRWSWLRQPAVVAAVLLSAGAGGAIGWRAGGLAGVAVGAVAGLLIAAVLVVAADRMTATGVTRPPDPRRRPDQDHDRRA